MTVPPAKATEALRVGGEAKEVAGMTAHVLCGQGSTVAVRKAPVGRQPG
jgi:hypothetical protein